MTPRQIAAYRFLKEREKVRGLRDGIAVASLGAHGDGRTIRDQMQALDKEL